MIVSGAENVYPAEVEEVLAQHPEVAEVAVFGLPDERWGEVVTAAVVGRDGEPPSTDELLAFARERLAGYKLPAARGHRLRAAQDRHRQGVQEGPARAVRLSIQGGAAGPASAPAAQTPSERPMISFMISVVPP